MQPFFSCSFADLYLGDALDVIPALDRRSADLVVTDPPYGVSFRSNMGQNFDPIEGDESTDIGYAVLHALLDAKVLRTHRHLYVFGPFDLHQLPLVVAKRELIWDKCLHGMGDLTLPWAPQHEPIQFGVNEPSKKARESGKCSLSARMRQGSVLRVQRPSGTAVNRHPTEKPVALLRQLVESSSVIGDTVLDPFAGCGSTLIAAAVCGRRAVGIELTEQYAETAAKRLQEVERLLPELNAA